MSIIISHAIILIIFTDLNKKKNHQVHCTASLIFFYKISKRKIPKQIKKKNYPKEKLCQYAKKKN